MVINLKPDEKRALVQIGYAVDNSGGATKEKIKILGKRDDDRDRYLSRFCEMKLCAKTGDVYTLTGLGQNFFDRLRRRNEMEGTTSSAVSGGSYKGY
jgi:hypothetical protein